jgi:predicted nucleotidyltransferase component of viral defense system
MITKTELMDFAKEFSLRPDIIEKDYVLGWVLAGIANQPSLTNNLIFKGGTCLKKCYFETYRFSEDLDYTVLNPQYMDVNILQVNFKQISEWINDIAGIEIPTDSIRFEKYQNNAGKESIEGRVGYIGPMQRRNSLARIKLDLTNDEILVYPAELREVHHPYSDKPLNGIKSNCYCFPEIFAEKIRALSERARPRDLYDVVHLYRHANKHAKAADILKILKKKCEYKSIPIPSVALLEAHPRLKELDTEWENMLSHQLPMLPPREQFWEELPAMFDWLNSGEWKGSQVIAKAQIKEEIDHTWQPPSMIHAWHQSTPLELVRYAGANHLCVELTYDNSKRLIEPYDLKRTKAGKLLIVAARHDTGEWRTYRVDKIQGLKVTQESFVPRAAISLTPFIA